jgi:hypothetical protein
VIICKAGFKKILFASSGFLYCSFMRLMEHIHVINFQVRVFAVISINMGLCVKLAFLLC